MASDIEGWDAQDQAEVLDEDNQSLDADGVVDNELKTFEDLPDVLDVTAAIGDADDEAGLIGEDLDDAQIIALEADQALADGEDDDLANRLPEAFNDDAELAASDGPEDPDLAEAEDGDVVSVHDARRATSLESVSVSDDDLDALGYDGARDRDTPDGPVD